MVLAVEGRGPGTHTSGNVEASALPKIAVYAKP